MKILKMCTQCKKDCYVYPSNKSLKNFCSFTCYGLWQRDKTFKDQDKKLNPIRLCSLIDCGNIHFGKNFCKKHYSSLIEYPKINPSRQIKRRTKTEKEIKTCKECSKSFISHKNAIFCSRICFSKNNTQPFILKKGYKKILNYLHPRADKKGYVFEHIIIMENHIQRSLFPGEEIHNKVIRLYLKLMRLPMANLQQKIARDCIEK